MTIKTEFQKFETYLRTLELKFFKGKLHQKAYAPNPGQTPAHVWVPVESHDTDAPAPGEAIVTETATSTSTGTFGGTSTATGTATAPPGGLLAPTGAHYDPPAGLASTGNAQVDPAKAEPVRYGDEGEIPPTPVAKAPQPEDVAKLQADPAAPAPKSAT